jgi:hypothetical protein
LPTVFFSSAFFKADFFFANFFFGAGSFLANVFVAGFLGRAPFVQAGFLELFVERRNKIWPEIGI